MTSCVQLHSERELRDVIDVMQRQIWFIFGPEKDRLLNLIVKLQFVLKVTAMSSHATLKSFAPLTDRTIDDPLMKPTPLLQHPLTEMIDVSDPGPVNSIL